MKKNSHKNWMRSHMEIEYTIILIYHTKRSVEKFLRYWSFFHFGSSHPLFGGSAVKHATCILDKHFRTYEKKVLWQYKVREFSLSNFVSKWLHCLLKCCSVWQTIHFSLLQYSSTVFMFDFPINDGNSYSNLRYQLFYK